MKTKTFLLIGVLFSLAACSLIWSPTATVKKFMAATQKGDVDTMTQLFSNRAIQRIGLDKLRANNQSFADTVKRTIVAGGNYRMENLQETSTPEGKRVSFFYRNDTNSPKFVFDLSQEGSAWKIDYITSPELEERPITRSDSELRTLASPPPLSSPDRSGVTTIVSAPPPPKESGEAETKPVLSGKTISGGVLNGKAISLPQPAYPPIAKAAKLSGTVVVQVLVDENGNVVSAQAVTGHPLLKAAAVAAARGAKFSPTKLSGELVKVSGVIQYNFAPQ